MPLNRAVAPPTRPQPDELTGAMVGIGMNFASRANPNANIEDTLLFVSVEGVEKDDLRVLAILVTENRRVRTVLMGGAYENDDRRAASWSGTLRVVRDPRNHARRALVVALLCAASSDDLAPAAPEQEDQRQQAQNAPRVRASAQPTRAPVTTAAAAAGLVGTGSVRSRGGVSQRVRRTGHVHRRSVARGSSDIAGGCLRVAARGTVWGRSIGRGTRVGHTRFGRRC
jgi:hypothetical protein